MSFYLQHNKNILLQNYYQKSQMNFQTLFQKLIEAVKNANLENPMDGSYHGVIQMMQNIGFGLESPNTITFEVNLHNGESFFFFRKWFIHFIPYLAKKTDEDILFNMFAMFASKSELYKLLCQAVYDKDYDSICHFMKHLNLKENETNLVKITVTSGNNKRTIYSAWFKRLVSLLSESRSDERIKVNMEALFGN